MGRSPCCDKVGLKKGPWTPEEDQKLLAYIEQHGHGSWRSLPVKAGLQRCGKSCRLRWTNYLRPDIKRGKFSLQEEQTIIQLHALLGNRWSAIATHLPKRTDNEIKNYWNTHLKKRLTKMGIDPVTHKPKNETLLSNDGQSKHVANLSHMAQWESARLEAEARLVRHSKLRSSTLQNNHLNSSSDHQFVSQSSTGPGPGPLNMSHFQFPQKESHDSALPGPPRCLDGLKALNGGGVSITGINGDLESPTSSTLSYSENATHVLKPLMELGGNSSGSYEAGILKDEDEEEDWKKLESSYRDGFENSISFESPWTTQETLPSDNFMEKFTDLLLGGSGDRSFSEGDGNTDNGGSSGSGGGGDDDSEYREEDNKNYWNSIFNLVNSSPSDSPVF